MFCFVEIVTTSQSIKFIPNCDTLQARQPFGNYSVLLYLYFTVIIFLIRLLCVTYRFRTTLTKNKQQFETHGFGCVSQQNMFKRSKIFHRSTDFRPQFLDIMNLCSQILQGILKCSFLYFVLLSHGLSQASQADTDLSVELMK